MLMGIVFDWNFELVMDWLIREVNLMYLVVYLESIVVFMLGYYCIWICVVIVFVGDLKFGYLLILRVCLLFKVKNMI